MKHLYLYIAMICVSIILQNGQVIVIWYSNLANINVGAITVIWSITPLFIAITDYFLFNIKLKYNYVIGIVLMIGSAVILSLYSLIFKPVSDIPGKKLMNSWVPVVCSLCIPLFFTMRYFIFRQMTDKKYGLMFNTSDLLSTSFFFINFLTLIITVIYWIQVQFDKQMFWIGLIGGAGETTALLLVYRAFNSGPGGPIAAFCTTSTVFVGIIESFRLQRIPTYIEILGLAMGLLGCLEFVYPELLEKIFCCFNKKKEETFEVDKNYKDIID